MPKGKRADHPPRARALVTPESGAHARITPLDSRRAEEFVEPDTELVALATARDEVELSGARRSDSKAETLEALEQRLQALEQELVATRESLRQKDLELHSLRAPGVPSLDSLRIPVNPVPADAMPSHAPPPRSMAQLPSAAPPRERESDSTWQPAGVRAGYPVLEHVAVALRASTLPPGADSIPPSQRRTPRRVCELELEFTEETQFYTGLTQDISEGGVFIATYRLFPIGSRLELSFELPDGTKINTWGRVRWLREESPHGSRPGMGVEFGDLTEEMLAAITRFCEQRPPLYMEV
jgi:uncharacterized protein (TIGR02266 family)